VTPIPADLLAEVLATFAPMTPEDAHRRAGVAIETLGLARSRSDVVQLGLALRTLDGGPLHRFRSATQARRERMLTAWATSPIPQLRTTYQALKRFALFLAYADPGADPAAPVNDLWEAVGYAPPERPAEPAEPMLTTLDVERGDTEPLILDADVVVVGSGAGGGVVAARLTEAGRAVVVVEAGGHRPERLMPVSEGETWREMLLDRGATSTDDLAITVLAAATLGGGTTVNWTTSIAPPKWLRDEWESAHGLAGLCAAETDADIARLTDELGLMPPSLVPPKERVILDGARALDWDADVTARNAGPCTECGGCTFGCQRGSKRSGLRSHLAAAHAGGARLLTDARVTGVRSRDGAVNGVVGRVSPGGRPFAVRAPQVVVAAGGLRTPVILERSGIEHPSIGHNLRLHPVVVVAARMAEWIEMWRGPLQAARSLEFALPGPAGDTVGPAHGGFVIEAAPAHPGLAMAAFPWTGRADALELASTLGHRAPIFALLRDHGAGRVRAGSDGTARITYRLDRQDADSARRALVELARLGRAGGAEELLALATPGRRWRSGDDFAGFLGELARLDTGPNRVTLFSAHQMGTARAGADPRTSATDPWGRIRLDRRGRLLQGAYVADGSLFPTPSGVNPMLTIMVLAERAARAAIDDRKAAAP
jgi:choline dehydrogenase-like flavoprotein